MKKLLILTEAGGSIGFGHYMRCSSLQRYFIAQGLPTEMKLYVKGEQSFDIIKGDVLHWLENKGEITQLAAEFNVVLVDSYLANEEYYHFLAETFSQVIAIDDYNRLTYPVDLIINPNVAATTIDYSNQSAQVFGGTKYVILREVFRGSLPLLEPNDKLENVLVTLGGSDFRNLIPRLTNLLMSYPFQTTVICGNDELVLPLKKQFPQAYFLGKRSASEMYSDYLAADLVIAACGQTLHELAALGKSVIGICLDKDQVPNMEHYVSEGFLGEALDWNDSQLEQSIANQIEGYIPKESRQKQQKYSTLIDVRGVEYIFKLVQKSFLNITYRLPTYRDCRLFFNWANDATVRANAFNTDLIDFESHRQWFKQKITDPNSIMLLFFVDGCAAGQLRIDTRENVGEIDYSVTSGHRKQGLGVFILRTAVQLTQNRQIVLQGVVKQENVGSCKAFIQAGFTLIRQKEVKGFPCLVYEHK